MADSTKVSNAPQPSATQVREWYEKHKRSIENFEIAQDSLKKLRDPKKSTNRKITTFDKETLRTYLQNISSNEKNLRNLSRYLFFRSQIYFKICYYFANMFDLNARSVVPEYDLTKEPDTNKMLKQYNDTLSLLDIMNPQYEFLKAYLTCFREDVFFGCAYYDDKSFFILPLDPDYCRIDGVWNDKSFSFSFDCSYFRGKEDVLEFWGDPFQSMYRTYNGNSDERWQPLPAENSVCLKFRSEDWENVVPPFVGLFNDLINLEDLRDTQAIADEAEIYKLLWIKLNTIQGTNEIDDWAIDPDLVVEYYNRLCESLPDYIAASIIPGDLSAITFDSDASTDTTKVQKATESVLNTSGGAQILNSAKISGTTAFTAVIRADTEFAISSLLPQTNAIINRLISTKTSTPCKVKLFEISIYTRDDFRKTLLEGGQYGLPTVLAYNTLNGFSEKDTLALNYLEQNVLNITSRFVPLQSSHTQSGSDNTDETGGRPKSDELTDEGERSIDKTDKE